MHGSMEGQDVLKMVESIEKDKEVKEKEKKMLEKKKVQENELFFRCKNKCVCTGLCQAKGLKECSVCHKIKRSICNKSLCMVNGRRSQMLPQWIQYQRWFIKWIWQRWQSERRRWLLWRIRWTKNWAIILSCANLETDWSTYFRKKHRRKVVCRYIWRRK